MIQRLAPMDQSKLTSLLLRLGLAIVFLYAAAGSLLQPQEWVGYLPPFLAKLSFADSLLKLFAIYEIVLALWLLSGRFVRYAGVLAALTFAGITLAQPSVFIVTFRDIGLLFMALALAALSWKHDA